METHTALVQGRKKPRIDKGMFAVVGKNLLVILVSLLIVIPLVLLLLNSVKDQAQSAVMGLDWPKAFHIENYLTVIQLGHVTTSFFNSLIYSCVPIVPIVVITSMAAFVFARNRTKLNNVLYFFIVLGITLPTNWMTLMKLVQVTHLYNTRAALCLLYIAGGISFNTFLFFGFMNSIPKELDEAAIIDGCSPLSMFFRVIFPLLTPVIATVAVLSFMGLWNDFINPLYFTNTTRLWPMTLAVFQFFGRQIGQFNKWNLVSADIVLTSLPVVVAYIISQRYIVAGMTMGSVKG
ncbi:MAG: carbohydrate ABC transporter permease [Spirochaetia bacterium]|jgi:raffinose/stachyose/melibiose transport system permease protein